MKEVNTYCDLCLSNKTKETANRVCVVCERDCCNQHMSDFLPQLNHSRSRPRREVCHVCAQTVVGDSSIKTPPDVEAALSRWQDEIIEKIRAAIAAETLAQGPITPHLPPRITLHRGPLQPTFTEENEEDAPPNPPKKQFPRRQMIP